MDRIDGFRIFVRVVETGSFSRAARDLGVTQPTVTRHIAALERHLGVRLLNRNTRRLSVTELGRSYYERGKSLLDLFEETESLAGGRQARLQGRIRIGTSVAFGRRVVTPLVLGFMRGYPLIQVELSFEDSYVDLVAQGIDVAVRMGKLADSSLGARYLGLNPWIAVAAPSYLKRSGIPATPQDLAQHNVLVYSTVQGDDHLHFIDGRNGRISVGVHGNLRSNNLSSILAAVRDGMGIAVLPVYVAARSLGTGHVAQVLAQFSLPSQEIHAVYPSPKLVPGKVTALIDYLHDAFARADWPAVLTHNAQETPRREKAAGQGARSAKTRA
jgi:DNA-binding transcriptional LysR family regulator